MASNSEACRIRCRASCWLNDIVRYWRTVTVDFVDKQRGQGGQGWGLRNAKLRMSRKLMFAAGLLSCFSCELFSSPEARTELIGPRHSTIAMEEHLREFMRQPPIEILALYLMRLDIDSGTTIKLMSAYDTFLRLLDDRSKREHLKKLKPDDIRSDTVFGEVRQFGHEFQDGLTALFFMNNERLETTDNCLWSFLVRLIGFSTGALTRGDFRRGLAFLQNQRVRAVELSALRKHELDPLVNALGTFDLSQFSCCLGPRPKQVWAGIRGPRRGHAGESGQSWMADCHTPRCDP